MKTCPHNWDGPVPKTGTDCRYPSPKWEHAVPKTGTDSGLPVINPSPKLGHPYPTISIAPTETAEGSAAKSKGRRDQRRAA